MEEPHSVSSPRRILSLSRKKRPGVSFSDSEDKASGFGVSGEHGPKTSEVYGFVGSITTIAATGPLYFSFFFFIFLAKWDVIQLRSCSCTFGILMEVIGRCGLSEDFTAAFTPLFIFHGNLVNQSIFHFSWHLSKSINF